MESLDECQFIVNGLLIVLPAHELERKVDKDSEDLTVSVRSGPKLTSPVVCWIRGGVAL